MKTLGTARVLFVLALAFTLFMALEPQPPHLFIDRFGDKFEHGLAFITLAALARVGWPRVAAPRLLEHLSFMGALIEVFQAIPSLHRDCDWKDWIADTVGVALGLWLAGRFAACWPGVQAGDERA